MTIGRDTQISQLNSSSSFYDWFLKENDEIIAKLNLINTFTIEGTNGITAPIDTNGKASIGLSGKVDLGISFNGPAYFNDFAAIPNVAVKVSQINSTVSGFTFGTPVRVYWDIDTNTVKYEPAKGSDPDQAEVMGVISKITSTHSYVTLLGKIDGDFSAVNVRGIGLTAGWIYFVDPGTTGAITDVEPTATGHVSKPVIMGLTGNSGLVLQMRGNYLNPVTTSPGITGSNVLILQCDKNLGPTLDVGMFASIYNLNTTEISNHFTNRRVYVAGVLQGKFPVPVTRIIGSELFGKSSYLVPALPTVTETGYKKLGELDLTTSHSSHVIGYIESITTDGTYHYYTINTGGYTTTKPKYFDEALAFSNTGCLFLNVAYDPGKPTTLEPTSTNSPDQPDYFVTNAQLFADVNDGANPNNNHIGIVYYGNKYFVKNSAYGKLDLNAGAGAQLRSTTVSGTNTNKNYLVNGNFAVWQRDNVGRSSQYTSVGNIAFADLWKRHDGVTGSDATKSYYLIRRSFDEYQSEIEGNPEYYIDIKALGLSAQGISGISGGGYTLSDHYLIGHVVPGAKTFDLNTINIKFYGKSSSTSYPVDIYFNRYSGGQLLEYNNLGTVVLTSSWQPYTISAYVPALTNNGIDIDLNNDYCEIGIDFIRSIELANINGITLGQDLYFSLASFSTNVGSSVAYSLYPEYNDQLNYCQQFYYTSYDLDQNTGSVNFTDSTTPTQNSHSIFIQPNKTCNLIKWPVKMRTTPTVSFYSAGTGLQNRVYNKTASTSTTILDTIQTSGTIGYGGEYRNGKDATIDGTPTTHGVNVCITNGVVNYDEVYFHIIADADFTI
jgi:hypothetical protein